MSLQGGLTIERMCMLARVSRAGFYRWLTAEAPGEEEMEVRAAIHEVVLEHRGRYGYRRVGPGVAPARSGCEPQACGTADG